MLLAVGPPEISNPDLPVSSVDSAPPGSQGGAPPQRGDGQVDRLPLALKPQSLPEKLLASPHRACSRQPAQNFISSLTLLTCKMGRWPWDNGDWAAGTGLASLRASVEEGGW